MVQSVTRKAFKDALASSYSDYVRKKQNKGEEPLSQEDWERKTQGGSGEDAKDMGAIERLRKKRKENPMGKKPSAIDKKKSRERYLDLSKKRREKMKQKALSKAKYTQKQKEQKALSKKQAHLLEAAWGFDKEAVHVPRQVTVRWDLGDDMPEYQDKDFRKALRKLRLPERVKIPAEVIEEWENEGRDDYIIDEWLSDEYGYLHYGWKAASVYKCGSGCPCTRCTCKRQAQELEDAWGSNQTKTARESRLVQKVKAMSDEERKNLKLDATRKFTQEQFAPAVDALVRKIERIVANEINSTARKLDITYVDFTTGELKPMPYKAQGMLEEMIPVLTKRLNDMV
ncbi:MAG: hypothetical protein VXX11_03625 [Planctomycetota bacterium]|nr:hypothetical protein [Planctomycetota bacterium]